MVLAVTEDAPRRGRAPHPAGRRRPTLVDALDDHRPREVQEDVRRTIDGGGAYVNNVRQSDPASARGSDDLLHDRYMVLRKDRHDVHVRPATVTLVPPPRPNVVAPGRGPAILIASLAVSVSAAVTLTSCRRGPDSVPSHRMSAWVNGTNFGEDIATLMADNARVPKVVPNGAGPCMARAARGDRRGGGEHRDALARPRGDGPVTKAYGLRGGRATRGYDAGSTNRPAPRPARPGRGIKAEALYDEVIQRIHAIDGKVPVDDHDRRYSGNTGGIFDYHPRTTSSIANAGACSGRCPPAST